MFCIFITLKRIDLSNVAIPQSKSNHKPDAKTTLECFLELIINNSSKR